MTKTVKNKMKYELFNTDGKARRGRLTFDRGTVETPAFMPVGTYGTVSLLSSRYKEIASPRL